MKSTIFILLYSLFLVNNVHSLLGGTPAQLGDYPSHALVIVNNVPFGGTILNANHILTSCGAVLNSLNELVPVGQVVIRTGSILFTGGTASSVIAIFPHPEYNPWTFNNDVAVLRLATNLVFNPNVINHPLAPAELNERVLQDGSTCIAVGFNAPTVAIPNPPLQTLQQPILNRDAACNIIGVHHGVVLESMICAGSVAANQGICPSTRGGGIYCHGNLTGVASHGLGCGAINSPGLYAQVRNYVPWITAQLTRTQIPPTIGGPTPPPGVIGVASSAIASTFLMCAAFLLTKL